MKAVKIGAISRVNKLVIEIFSHIDENFDSSSFFFFVHGTETNTVHHIPSDMYDRIH